MSRPLLDLEKRSLSSVKMSRPLLDLEKEMWQASFSCCFFLPAVFSFSVTECVQYVATFAAFTSRQALKTKGRDYSCQQRQQKTGKKADPFDQAEEMHALTCHSAIMASFRLCSFEACASNHSGGVMPSKNSLYFLGGHVNVGVGVGVVHMCVQCVWLCMCMYLCVCMHTSKSSCLSYFIGMHSCLH